MSKTINCTNNNLCSTNQINSEIRLIYNRAIHSSQHQEYTKNMKMYLPELDASKSHSPYRLKIMQSHTTCPEGMQHTPFKNHLEKGTTTGTKNSSTAKGG